MNKQQLAAKIWASANNMRSKIEASEYKDFILGFIFYKYLSDKEEQFMLKGGMSVDELPMLTEDDAESVEYCQKNLGYFIAYKNLFSTWLGLQKDFSVMNVTTALSAFERLINPDYSKLFKDVFSSLSKGLSKLGSTAAQQSKSIMDLLSLIRDIPTDDSQGYDVLGFIYEYLISNFAANAGKKAGEFYTPHEVSLLMAEIVAHHLRNKDNIQIYDPTSGSGSLLLNIGRAVGKHRTNKDSIQYYAQELKEATYNLTRMNLVMRGIKPSNIEVRNADTLEEDWPKDEKNGMPTLYLDAVVSNPPYSQGWSTKDKELDPRYRYGIAPKGKADYAFLLHDLYHLRPDGIMTIVLPHGVLFRGDAEGEIRKNLIENNHIDAIIGLPANIFFGTGIATIVMVLRQKRDNDDILIIDASKGFEKSGKNNKLRASDIRRVVDCYINRSETPKFSRKVTRQEIRDNEYNLNLPRYIDSSDDPETWDIYSTIYGGMPESEVAQLQKYWEAFPTLKASLLHKQGVTYVLRDENLQQLSDADVSVQEFCAKYKERMVSLPEYLKERLFGNIAAINVSQEEDTIAHNLFERIADMPLIDRYMGYQLLDDVWATISGDLEILQTEGFDATRVVEPNLVLKKKKNSAGEEVEEEVQEGWKGRIMPFELVQQTMLTEEVAALKLEQEHLDALVAELDEAKEALSEEAKSRIMDEEGAKLDTKELSAAVKEIWADLMTEKGYDSLKKKAYKEQLEKLQAEYVFEPESDEALYIRIDNNLSDQKVLKKSIREQTMLLQEKTRTTIEALTDELVYELLRLKWIQPLVESLDSIPGKLIAECLTAIRVLNKKYCDTLVGIDEEIETSERELASLLGELTGSDEDMAAINELKKLMGGL